MQAFIKILGLPNIDSLRYTTLNSIHSKHKYLYEQEATLLSNSHKPIGNCAEPDLSERISPPPAIFYSNEKYSSISDKPSYTHPDLSPS